MAAANSSGASAFERLAPFIQEYIWKNRWTELRAIQARATAAAFDSETTSCLQQAPPAARPKPRSSDSTQLHEEVLGQSAPCTSGRSKR